jgi:signal transduction histidine kinase
MTPPITGPKTYRRHDTAAEGLPENVRRRLERDLLCHVTVVDDTGDLLAVLEPLVPEGWTIHAHRSPIDALANLSTERPVAVIANLSAQSFDGLSFLQEVAGAMPDVRRILATDQAGPSEILRAVNEVGVHRVIGTPLTQDHVEEALEGAYAQRRREMAVEYLLEDLRAQNAQLTSASAALEERESHLLHSERLAVLGRLTDGLAAGIQPLLGELREVVASLTSSEADPDHDDLLGIGHDAVEAIWDIIEDIGRFTRDDTLELRREPTELGELVRRTVRFASFDRRLRMRTLVVEADLAIHLSVDARRIRQVLLNLMRNAADATDEGAKIRITLHREEAWAELKVSDEGAGMPPQVADLVFEEFFSTKGDGGLGLGLALCRSTIVQHGGTIQCETALGLGTTFTVRLPLVG